MSMTDAQARQLGTMLSRARARKGWSLRQLAAMLHTDFRWLGFLEQGRFLDPAPDRLARIAEALDIEPGRIDRITKGSVSSSLPGLRTYFRAKYDLTPEQIERVERYVRRIQRGSSS